MHTISKSEILLFIFILIVLPSLTFSQLNKIEEPKVILTIKPDNFKFIKQSLKNKEYIEFNQNDDSITVIIKPIKEVRFETWTLKKEARGSERNLMGILKVYPDGTYKIEDSQDFNLKIENVQSQQPKIFKCDTDTLHPFHKTLAYSILPGGGRFFAGHKWQGLALAASELALFSYAIYSFSEHQKCYALSEYAADRGDRTELDKYYDKSKTWQERAGYALLGALIPTIFNIFDVKKHVKEIRCEPHFSNNGFELNFAKNF